MPTRSFLRVGGWGLGSFVCHVCHTTPHVAHVACGKTAPRHATFATHPYRGVATWQGCGVAKAATRKKLHVKNYEGKNYVEAPHAPN